MGNGLPTRISAVVRTAESRDSLLAALAHEPRVQVDIRIGALKDTRLSFVDGKAPEVLLCDVDMHDADDLAALHFLKREVINGHTALIATSDSLSTAAIRSLLRDGVDDFLPQPFTHEEMVEALRTADAKTRSRTGDNGGRGRVYAFTRGCGGMGATTLAVNTACALVGAKSSRSRVCLIDLDVQFGVAGLYLDLENRSGLIEIAAQPERLDAELLRAAVSTAEGGFDVLTAPAVPIPLDALKTEVVGQLIDVARQHYDFVVVDLPHALTDWMEAILLRADRVLVVTQLSVPAIHQTRKIIDALHDDGRSQVPVGVLLNRYRKRWGDSIDLRQAEKALGMPFSYVIPNDFDLVSESVNRGVPAYEINRRSRFGRAIEDMVASDAKDFARAEANASSGS